MVDVPIPYCKLGVYFLESAFPAVTALASIRTHSPRLSVFSLQSSPCLLFLLVIALYLWHKVDSLSIHYHQPHPRCRTATLPAPRPVKSQPL